jgi:hypothetical protein
VHRVAALFERWLLRTNAGAVSRKRPDYYLDEFTSRLNRRTSGPGGKLFWRLAQQAVQVGPLRYRAIVGRPELERTGTAFHLNVAGEACWAWMLTRIYLWSRLGRPAVASEHAKLAASPKSLLKEEADGSD